MNTPETKKVRAIDVKPHFWGIWCTVGDCKDPFVNEIVSRKWSDDHKTIWFMLESHNFSEAAPDEEMELVPLDPKRSGYVDDAWLERMLLEDEIKMDLSLHRKEPCRSCGGTGIVHVVPNVHDFIANGRLMANALKKEPPL